MRKEQIKHTLLNNLSWFLAAWMLAFIVWLLATVEADPIQERTFSQIAIQVEVDSNLTIVSQTLDTANVIIHTQRSILSRLTAEDITVRADLRGFGAGVHTVELATDVTRHAIADPQPRQITVTLEEMLSLPIPVVPYIAANPPAGYVVSGDPVFGETEVILSGAASRVQRVVAARARLDLSSQRDTLEADVRLIPVDADGVTVAGVELLPATVRVTVTVNLREDVRIVPVEPDIDSDTLPEGYEVTSISYDPKTIMVVGSEEALAFLPDALSTEQITLDERTENFEVSVPILFDRDDLTLLGERTVTISISIAPLEITLPFENIPVTVIGLDQTRLQAELVTDRVRVFVKGPQSALSTLRTEDISAVLDLNGLPPGTYDVTLSVASSVGQIESVSHPAITVTITEIAPEQTETPQP